MIQHLFFVICKNYFLLSKSANWKLMLSLNYILFLCFCFKSLALLHRQTIHLDFSLSTLFFIFTSSSLKLWVQSLHPKQYVVLDCVFSISHIVGKIFLTIHFKHFALIELCSLNFISNNSFEIFPVNETLVDISVCFLIDSAM